MNIFTCVEQVPDACSDIAPVATADYINTEYVRWSINPEDERAVEQALLIRDQYPDTFITALRVGPEQDSDALIDALAMGADDAVLVIAQDQQLDPIMAARALKGAIELSEKKPDLILCGNTSYTDDSSQVPQLLAQFLGMPCVTRVMEFVINDDELNLKSQNERGGIESYKAHLPIVVACSYWLNTPRYAPFPYIKKAYEKPILRLSLQDTGVTKADQRLRYFNYRLAPAKGGGTIFNATNKNNMKKVVADIIETIRADIKLF